MKALAHEDILPSDAGVCLRKAQVVELEAEESDARERCVIFPNYAILDLTSETWQAVETEKQHTCRPTRP